MKNMVIVADSSFVIETIHLALRNAVGLKVIGKLDGRKPVRDAIAESQPDIVLIDEMQSEDDALERIRECRDQAPETAVLLLTMRMDDAWLSRAFGAGIDACLSKSGPLPTLGTVIREVVNRNVISALPASMLKGPVALPEGDELTPRESEILGLVADGLTNAKIAQQLWVTEQTVKFHLSNIYRKLDVSNRTEASRFAHVNGLLRRTGTRFAAEAQPKRDLAPVRQLRPLTTSPAA